MTIQCRVTVDDSQYIDEVPFQAVPRVGESVSMTIDGDTLTLRVSRVVHVPDRATPDGGSIVVELTRKIL